jgi:Gas vesicle protein G
VGLLTLLPKLPFLPMREVIRIAELIRQETERQYRDPGRVRRELEEAQQQWASGGMSDDELSRIEYTATSRLYGGMPANPPDRPNRPNRPKRKTGGDRHG